MTECILQGGVNALHLAAIGNHTEVVRALVGEFGLSVAHRDNVSCIVYVNISLMFCLQNNLTIVQYVLLSRQWLKFTAVLCSCWYLTVQCPNRVAPNLHKIILPM